MILLIDNYDSFTYNLVQLIQMLGEHVHVCRNDHINLPEIKSVNPSALVISPGPGAPCQAGISMEAIRFWGPRIPVLGVCLGHQAIAEAFGGKVTRANRIMHGKISEICHDGRTLYRGLPDTFKATRYHSLIVERDAVPECLDVSAWSREGEIMGLRHREYNVEGVQFHPESILTDLGSLILKNFIHLTINKRDRHHGQSCEHSGFVSSRLEGKNIYC